MTFEQKEISLEYFKNLIAIAAADGKLEDNEKEQEHECIKKRVEVCLLPVCCLDEVVSVGERRQIGDRFSNRRHGFNCNECP